MVTVSETPADQMRHRQSNLCQKRPTKQGGWEMVCCRCAKQRMICSAPSKSHNCWKAKNKRNWMFKLENWTNLFCATRLLLCTTLARERRISHFGQKIVKNNSIFAVNISRICSLWHRVVYHGCALIIQLIFFLISYDSHWLILFI